jgi:hypothetical protein
MVHCKGQTRPLVRDGNPINKPATVRQKKSGLKPQMGA